MGGVGSLTPGWTGSTRLPPRTSQGRAPLTRELSPDVITLTVSPERHRYRDRVIGGGQPGTRGGRGSPDLGHYWSSGVKGLSRGLH